MTHPELVNFISNLGTQLRTRCEMLGSVDDLHRAVELAATALNLTPDDNPFRPDRLQAKGNALLIRFEHTKSTDDLNQAIADYRRAVELRSNDHPRYPSLVASLRVSLLEKGSRDDVNSAIAKFQEVLSMTPEHSPMNLDRLNDWQMHLHADLYCGRAI